MSSLRFPSSQSPVPGRSRAARRITLLLLSGGFLSSIAATAASAQEAPPAQSARDPHATHIAEAARRFGIPAPWIRAVLRAESAGDRMAVSAAGAMGLMQVMPATWKEMQARYRLGTDPFDARDNILAGTAYLREMLNRYGNAGAMLAAYNAGPARYDAFLDEGRALPTETRTYVASLAPLLGGDALSAGLAAAPAAPSDWREASLFVAPSEVASPGAEPRDEPANPHAPGPAAAFFVARSLPGGAP